MFHWTEEQWHIGLMIGQYIAYPLCYWLIKRGADKGRTSLRNLIGESVRENLNGQLKSLETRISKRLDEHELRLSAGDNRFERIEKLLADISKDVKSNSNGKPQRKAK